MSLVAIAADDVHEYHGPLVPSYAMVYADRDFRASDGTFVRKGSPTTHKDFGQRITASMNGSSIRLGTSSLYATTDAIFNADAGYKVAVFTATNKLITVLFEDRLLKIPPTPTPTTWAAIQVFSRTLPAKYAPTFYDTVTLEARLALMGDAVTKANELAIGVTRLSVAPVNALTPIAVGDNDPRVGGVVGSYAKPNLPAPGVVGQMAKLTDENRGLVYDTGSDWVSLNGEVFDVQAFGAVGDGVTDDTPAIQAAITAAMASIRGGRVTFPRPSAYYKCTQPLDLDNAYNVTLEGVGAPLGLGGTTAGAIVYTATGSAAFISARYSQGLTIKNLRILYSSTTYTGDLIDASGLGGGQDTQSLTIDTCELRGSTVTACNARCLVNIFQAILVNIRNTQFSWAEYGVMGKPTGVGGYSNVVNITDNCLFLQLKTNGILNGGEQWNIVGNTFEPTISGKACGYTEDQQSYSVNISNNWFGDVTVAGTPWVLWGGNFLTMSDNLMGTAGAAQAGIVLGIGLAIQSVTMLGNRYNQPTTCIATAGGATIGAFHSVGDWTLGGTYLTDALSQIARKNIVGATNAFYDSTFQNAFKTGYVASPAGLTGDAANNHVGFFDGSVGGTHYALGYATRTSDETPHEFFTGTTPTRRFGMGVNNYSYTHLLFSADNTKDIGAAGATRPRNVYVGTAVYAAANAYGAGWNNSLRLATEDAVYDQMELKANLVSPSFTTPVLGAATATSIAATAGITSSGGGIGYATGAGGTVAQATSKSTGVTLDKYSGTITMNAAALGANTVVSFVLTNNKISAGDRLILNHESGGTIGAYMLTHGACGAGTVTIYVRNLTGGSLSEAVVIGFTLLEGVTA